MIIIALALPFTNQGRRLVTPKIKATKWTDACSHIDDVQPERGRGQRREREEF